MPPLARSAGNEDPEGPQPFGTTKSVYDTPAKWSICACDVLAKPQRSKYRGGMRLCTKTGCGAHAVAACAFNYGRRLVWISPLVPDQDPSFYDLCQAHVEALVVPRGWSLEDHRPGEPAVEQPSLLA